MIVVKVLPAALLLSLPALVKSTADPYTPGQATYSCDGDLMAPSPTVPTNVNKVRPADIKVVAALGDSLTAANGALATDIIEVVNMYRGVSFSIGGDGNLSYTVTIPNILKKYNPNVYGQSYGHEPMGLPTNRAQAQFNVAVPGSECPDLIPQATELVQLMKADSKVDYNNDWKLVTLFFGGNDACEYCLHKETYAPDAMKTCLRTVLHELSVMPRTIVQLVGMLHVEILRKVPDDLQCQTLHIFECKCDDDEYMTNADFAALELAYQQRQKEVMNEGEYDRSDFTFVVQPMIEKSLKPPMNTDGTVDVKFFAPDCFHFSIKGHNTAARFLWNNMLQPVGAKTNNSDLSDQFDTLACPDKACPFIRTPKNSDNCATFMQ